MNGTFLNFFECKLDNNLMEVYSIDYMGNENLEYLRKNIQIYFFIDLMVIKYIIGRKKIIVIYQ